MKQEDSFEGLAGQVLAAYYRPGRERYRRWLIEVETRRLLYDNSYVPCPPLPDGCDFAAIAMEYNAEKH